MFPSFNRRIPSAFRRVVRLLYHTCPRLSEGVVSEKKPRPLQGRASLFFHAPSWGLLGTCSAAAEAGSVPFRMAMNSSPVMVSFFKRYWASSSSFCLWVSRIVRAFWWASLTTEKTASSMRAAVSGAQAREVSPQGPDYP